MRTVISAFFSGTGHSASSSNTLVYLLNHYIKKESLDRVMSFDGCAVTNGWQGLVFGKGLDKQCQKVIKRVASAIKGGEIVTLNVYGHSRGAIAALMLAKQLSNVVPSLLEINLALLDPVPGNLIITSTLDLFNISLTKKTMDLRECRPLKSVLALYPHQSLPALSFHAPLFSLYPNHTKVEIDIIAGCHSNAQFQDLFVNKIIFSRASFITFARVFSFLKKHGSQFNSLPVLEVDDLPSLHITTTNLDSALLEIYRKENELPHQQATRECHSAVGLKIYTKKHAEYFNLHHQRLAKSPEDKSNIRVTLEKTYNPISLIKRLFIHTPKIWPTLRWLLISFGCATILSLSIIPIAGAIVLLGIIPLALLAGGILNKLWTNTLEPVLSKCINSIFYPKYATREIIPSRYIPNLNNTSPLFQPLRPKQKITRSFFSISNSTTSLNHEPEALDDKILKSTL